MYKKNILTVIFLIILVVVLGCSSNNITGEVVATYDIYEDVPEDEAGIYEDSIYEEGTPIEEQAETVEEQTEEILEEVLIEEPEEELVIIEDEPDGFELSPESIFNTQNNISLSIDDIQYEIKGENWGKIIGITTTVINNGDTTFKPKAIVRLHDDGDLAEERVKPKAEIEFDVEELKPGEHVTKQAIVNIAFNDLLLTKEFELILVDANTAGHRSLVSVETEFYAYK